MRDQKKFTRETEGAVDLRGKVGKCVLGCPVERCGFDRVVGPEAYWSRSRETGRERTRNRERTQPQRGVTTSKCEDLSSRLAAKTT